MILKSFCEFNCDVFSVELGRFSSMKGRFLCFKTLLQKIAFLPFALVLKALGTSFRLIAFALAAISYIVTLGSSCKAQEVLARRGTALAKDFADWIMFPFVVGSGLFRLFIGTTLTPAIYFQ